MRPYKEVCHGGNLHRENYDVVRSEGETIPSNGWDRWKHGGNKWNGKVL